MGWLEAARPRLARATRCMAIRDRRENGADMGSFDGLGDKAGCDKADVFEQYLVSIRNADIIFLPYADDTFMWAIFGGAFRDF